MKVKLNKITKLIDKESLYYIDMQLDKLQLYEVSVEIHKLSKDEIDEKMDFLRRSLDIVSNEYKAFGVLFTGSYYKNPIANKLEYDYDHIIYYLDKENDLIIEFNIIHNPNKKLSYPPGDYDEEYFDDECNIKMYTLDVDKVINLLK